MTRRGMTLLETLLSLALLATLAAACASLARFAGRDASLLAGPARWEQVAHATTRLIGDTLVSGDFVPAGAAAQRNQAAPVRAAILDDALLIPGRAPAGVEQAGGPTMVVFRFDAAASRLLREEWPGSDPVRPAMTIGEARVLLGGVASWSLALDEDARTLSVEIRSETSQVVAKVFPLP